METGSQEAQRLIAGRYRLAGVLGRGAMGVVWRGHDELIGRSVAVKELRVPPGLSDEERSVFAERALREARTAGRLNHPGVVAIYDLVPATPEDDAVYIVMELVEAPSLAELLQRNAALPEARVSRMAGQLLAALDAAHSIGLVHRDIKPSNIMVLPGDEVKLVDFGIAHAMDDTRLTRHGIAGSTGYMAPELFEGADPSPSADLWSLGATLFHAVEGHDPFARQTTAATLHAILHDELPPLSCRPPLLPLITGLLTRDTAARMTSEEARALLPSPTIATTTTPPAAGPPRPGRTTSEDHTTTATPTTTPPPTPSAPPTPSSQATWEDHPTTVRQHTDVHPAGPVPDSPPADPSIRTSGAKRRKATWIALAVMAMILLVAGAFAFFPTSEEPKDEEKLKKQAQKVTLDFIWAYSRYDFDAACRLLVFRAHVSSAMRFPECGNADERRRSENGKLAGHYANVTDPVEVKSVELMDNSKARVVVDRLNDQLGVSGVWILRRSGDSWLIELS
ncbi:MULTISPECIES: serine/threonine-protein kinase [unclassified Streptomyces]|uniref:serine/threonine-protein kinase n=1 Tax=unclassified Streptomyces TaxID=2593676 RepID=UPI00336ABE79